MNTPDLARRPRLLVDDALDPASPHADPDQLGRDTLAAHLHALLSRLHEQSQTGAGSSVIGLVGPWGSGKTSVLNQLAQRLGPGATTGSSADGDRVAHRTRRDAGGDGGASGAGNATGEAWVVTWFTPWQYADTLSLQLGFFAELRQALPADDRWPEGRKRLGALATSLAPLASLTSLVGADSSEIIKLLGGAIAGDISVSAVQRQAEDALRELDQPILVILDDLDRLEAPELLLTIKLVRMIGRLPNVHYLLSYDEQTLIDLLKHTSLVGDSDARALDYLEKLVQVRVDLPALRPYQCSTLFEYALQAVTDDHSIELDEEQVSRLRRHLNQRGLLRRLDTPRTINRVMGQVDAFYGLLDGEVDFVDYLVLTWLRTEEPRVYRMVESLRDEVLGTTEEQLYRRVSTKQNLSTVQERWRERLRGAVADPHDIEMILDLLGEMFPVVQAEAHGELPHDTTSDAVAHRKGVGHPYYFDTYFSFGVPSEGVADRVITTALQTLSAQDANTPTDPASGADTAVEHAAGEAAVKRVRAELRGDTGRIIWKLERHLPTDGHAIGPLLDLLAQEYPGLHDDGMVLMLDRQDRVAGFVHRLLTRADAATVAAFTDAQVATTQGLRLISAALRIAVPTRDPDEAAAIAHSTPWWVEGVSSKVSATYARLHNDYGEASLADFGRAGVGTWYWWRWIDRGQADRWLVAQVNSSWDLLQTLALWIGTQRLVGVRNPRLRLGELDEDFVNEVFGIDQVLNQLAHDIPQDPMHLARGGEDIKDTPDNRRRLVLATLQSWRRRRAAPPPPPPDPPNTGS